MLSFAAYRDTASTLQAESGFTVEDPAVASFRQSILEGRWSDVEAIVSSLPLERPESALVCSLLCIPSGE